MLANPSQLRLRREAAEQRRLRTCRNAPRASKLAARVSVEVDAGGAEQLAVFTRHSVVFYLKELGRCSDGRFAWFQDEHELAAVHFESGVCNVDAWLHFRLGLIVVECVRLGGRQLLVAVRHDLCFWFDLDGRITACRLWRRLFVIAFAGEGCVGMRCGSIERYSSPATTAIGKSEHTFLCKLSRPDLSVAP